MAHLVSFDALPHDKDGPPGNAWGLFGKDDECGMLNMLTPENTAKATKEIKEGVRVSTDWPLNSMKEPFFGRPPLSHSIKQKGDSTINDDEVHFNTQSSSQWDGFRHFGFQNDQVFFNGKRQKDLVGSDVNGIQAWVNRGGIVGRGVLLDYAAWADAKGIEMKHFETNSIPVSVLEEVAASQGTEFQRGDILLIRSGWIRAYEALPDDTRKSLAGRQSQRGIGIESSEETLRWLWKHAFAAAAGDHPTLEAWPCQNPDFWLHEWLLAGWGMPIGELFDLERLSQECQERKRWTFFFSSMPLKVPGGVASPPNGMAIF
ncbi:hypothetical protein HIM_02246 [Hirsutella minnesotensis 3608]|nr:hypothetical protein HIM_02246 [Hirsutella minnesotensis 3608]